MATLSISVAGVAELLAGLLGREVAGAPSEDMQPHPATYRGLVTNENVLMAIIGSDLEFAHRSAAALAMVPVATVEDKGEVPDHDLLEFYDEVANVLSRVVNEAVSVRLRIDPGMVHPAEAMAAIVDGGARIVACQANFEGYGSGSVGVWIRTS